MGDVRGRLIAFDLDGTLVDSRRDLADSANALIAELGGTPLPEEAVGRMVGEGATMLVALALRAAGLATLAGGEPLQASLQRFLEIYDGRLLRHTTSYPGIPEAVAEARRHARVAVLTNKPARATHAVLDGLGLAPLFDDVIGGDGPWPRKPDPASLLALIERAGAEPARALLVGDSLVDLDTARRAGARVCLALWGFGYDTVRPVLRGMSFDAAPGACTSAGWQRVDNYIQNDGSLYWSVGTGFGGTGGIAENAAILGYSNNPCCAEPNGYDNDWYQAIRMQYSGTSTLSFDYLLDYGAGKCRLFQNLKVQHRMKLQAYDPGVPRHLTYPRMRVHDLLERTAREHPRALALVYGGVVGSRCVDAAMTYAKLDDLADRFAA